MIRQNRVTKHILFVDDEANVREVVRVCLHKLGGWHILTAASGHEGLTLAQSTAPDAILLDIMMPGMNGLMMVEELGRHPRTQGIPVILLTADAPLTLPRAVLPPGVTAAIAKPFKPIDLVEQIATTLCWNLETSLC